MEKELKELKEEVAKLRMELERVNRIVYVPQVIPNYQPSYPSYSPTTPPWQTPVWSAVFTNNSTVANTRLVF